MAMTKSEAMASRSAKPSLCEPTPDSMRCRLRMALSVRGDRFVGAQAERISQPAIGVTPDVDAVQLFERRVHGVRFAFTDGGRVAAETKVVGCRIDEERRLGERLCGREQRGRQVDD